VLLGTTAEKLEKVGIQTLAVIGSSADRARLYLRYRPTRCLVGGDPDLATHQAYGVPRGAISPEIWAAVESGAAELARQLRLPATEGTAFEAIDRLDGFQTDESDRRDLERHQAQFTAQFLIDRRGIVRWSNIECARDGLAGVDKFPTDEQILAAARALDD
jgi:hypothetical protein